MAGRLYSRPRLFHSARRRAHRTHGVLSPLRLLAVAGMLILALIACSKHSGGDHDRSALSERQRDSAIAKSRLPGAGVVGKALAVTDSTAARAARIDSLTR